MLGYFFALFPSGAHGGGKCFFFFGSEDNGTVSYPLYSEGDTQRGSETKKEDPDYWETSRPVQKDGMIPGKRNPPVNKEVIYLDFRAEVSAFDKIFHFSKEGLDKRKELLRKRSVYLKRLFSDEAMRFKGVADEKMGKMEVLSPKLVEIIGSILNKHQFTTFELF